MRRMEKYVVKPFWTFAIVAVIFLAPSSGLITLTIPDEPYGSVINIPDSPHIAKRASDDSKHLASVAVSATHTIHHTFFSVGAVALTHTSAPYTSHPLPDQIRGPPAISIA